MEDFARITAAPRNFTILGKDYRVGKFTPRGLGDITAFLKDFFPDPRVQARELMEGLPDNVQLHIWNNATENAKSWPPSLNSNEGIGALLSEKGQAVFLWVLLRQHNDGFTLEKANEISANYEMDVDDLTRLMEMASPGEVGDVRDPKVVKGVSVTKRSARNSA